MNKHERNETIENIRSFVLQKELNALGLELDNIVDKAFGRSFVRTFSRVNIYKNFREQSPAELSETFRNVFSKYLKLTKVTHIYLNRDFKNLLETTKASGGRYLFDHLKCDFTSIVPNIHSIEDISASICNLLTDYIIINDENNQVVVGIDVSYLSELGYVE